MKLLSIETSDKMCGACILDDENIIDKLELNNGLTHSESLMPLISELLTKNNVTLSDIDGFVCDIGPGSFTGIRIGVSTVKAFVDSMDNKLYTGVSSLEALAYNVAENSIICSTIDAKNDNCYFALYDLENSSYKEIYKPTASTITEMIDIINNTKNAYSKPIVFVGSGAIEYKDTILNSVANATFLQEDLNYIKTSNLAIAGFRKIYSNNQVDLSPLYLKKPQAQRQFEEKLNIQITQMTLDDLEKIKDKLTSDFDDFWNYNVLKNELNSNTSTCFVAKISEKIVGFVGIQFVVDEACITNIVTRKDFRNNGIGSALMEKIISVSKEKNMSSITLEVNEHNTYALNLYKKYGFEINGLRKKYYNGIDNAVIMTMNLPK